MKYAALLAGIALCAASHVHASPITLDFETPQTGSSLWNTPLVTAAGTISTSTIGTGNLFVQAGFGPTGLSLRHAQSANNNDAGLINFSFDVASITFDYAGVGVFSQILVQALDASGNVVDSFFNTDADCGLGCFDGTGIVLSGVGIRSMKFADVDSASNMSAVDNLIVQPAAQVPTPGTLACAIAALAVLAGLRRRTSAAAA